MAAVDQFVFVYIIGPEQGPVKVGQSHSPDKRALQLRSHPSEKLFVLGKYPVGKAIALSVERYAHWILRDKHIGREWFEVSRDEAEKAIREAIAGNLHPDYPMPPLNDYPGELKGGTYVRTKIAKGVMERLHLASNGRHADFIREAVERELERREAEKR